MARQRKMKSDRLRRIEANNDRCPARHPSWHGVRCEQRHTDHVVHSNEDSGGFVWVDARRNALMGDTLVSTITHRVAAREA